MTSAFQPGAMLYTQSFASRPENLEVPQIMNRAPNSGAYGDTGGGSFTPGKRWIWVGNAEYVLLSLTYPSGVPTPTWALVTSEAGDVVQIATDSGTATPNSSGVITFTASATGLSFSGSVNTVTLGGTLDVANGGTGASTLTAHGVLVGEGTGPVVATAHGTSGQLLQSGGSSADPAWTTSTYPATNAVNTLLYASSANVMAALATANSAILNTSSGGVPSLATSPSVSGTITAGTGLVATTGSVTATAGQVIAGGDVGGVASTTSLTNTNSTTISSGTGTVKMSSANNANNTAWIKIYVGTSAYYIPAWTTNSP